MSKITILGFGTRGDIQPLVALGKRLSAQGHDVLLGGPDNFADWVGGHGLKFHPLGFDMEALIQTPEMRNLLSGNVFALAKAWRRQISPMVRSQLEATWAAAREAEIVIYHPKAAGAVDVAETAEAVAVCASPIPMFPTGEFPAIPFPENYGRMLNRATYELHRLARPMFLSVLNRWRAETLGLGKGPVWSRIGELSNGMATRLCAVSPSVVPRPRDWDEDSHMTGYWFLDEGRDWRPDAELAAFLEAGDPPVYIGFGSMPTKDPAHVARVVAEGVRRAGVRAILATGWGGMAKIDVPSTLHVIQGAPHQALFEHVRAVVHHGGAGTTAVGLRAGRPTLVCPLAVDQPYWGRRVHSLGCGPRPQSLRTLRSDRFAAALEELVQSDRYRNRAEALGRAIRAEDGTGRAVEIILAAAATRA